MSTRPRAAPDKRLVVAALIALLLLAVGASLAIGARAMPMSAVWQALTDPQGTPDDAVVRQLRIPRTILGVLVGLALGAAGALMQGHTRNPLAEPGLLGVSAGAEFAVVGFLTVAVHSSPLTISAVSIVGAGAATMLVLALGGAAGRAYGAMSPVPLALAGVALAALCGAAANALILINISVLQQYRIWAAGSLADRNSQVVAGAAPLVIAGLLLAVANLRALNALSLGEATARSLGHRVGRARLVGVAAITLLTGAAVAGAGPIVFLGLASPHVARALVGADYRWILPVSALGGAVLLLFADVLGRMIARPGEVPVGVVMAVIGAPVLIVLARRGRMVTL
ncbi:MAG: FecCD family ABC transporter permease [Candidatus Nanopelagicales bacterium]